VIKIRLQRIGRKKHPFYRIVAAEHSAPIKGRFVEILGHYNPINNQKDTVFEKEKLLRYIQNGAQPTQTVARLGVKHGITELKKFIDQRKMKPSKKELEEQKRKEEEAQKLKKEKEEAEAKKQAEEQAMKESEAELAKDSPESSEETPA
jgi:small subunit ribosomal protein S16